MAWSDLLFNPLAAFAVSGLGIATTVAGITGLVGTHDRAIRAARRRYLRALAGGSTDEIFEGTLERDPGPLEAPLSGTPAVWFEITADEEGAGEDNWQRVHASASQGALVVRTERGATAIEATSLDGDLHERSESGPVVDGPDRLERWLIENGLPRAGQDGFKRRRRYTETRVAPNRRVHGIGRSIASAPAGASEPYRQSSPATLEDVRVHGRTVAKYLRLTASSTIVFGTAVLLLGLALDLAAAVLWYRSIVDVM